MRSYLSLIPISAKVHKRQNRLTMLCIIFAVFMVTTIFSLADMSVRMEKSHLSGKHGNWHVAISDLSNQQADEIRSRSDIEAASWHDVINKDVGGEYYINNKRVVINGVESEYLTKLYDGIKEGKSCENEHDIVLTPNAKSKCGMKVGDQVTVNTPGGDVDFKVSGFGEDDDQFDNQDYAFCAYINKTTFDKISSLNPGESDKQELYIKFKPQVNVSQTIREIKDQYKLADKSIDENNAVLALSGESSNKTVLGLYSIAAVLFVLILFAGVLMIAGSINSNVAQRTKFFGMMRCIGASRKQIIRFVRLEALNWCKIAIPIGVIIGTLISWAICAVLRYGIGGEFAEMPVFRLSGIGIISGVIVGVVTVLLASQSPAKRAAKVSPAAAVSGGVEQIKERKNAKMRFFKIDSALGIHHAVSAKKNLILMTGSIALSIILFLVFCTGLELIHALMPSIRSWQPDATIIGFENASTVDKSLVEQINQMPGVKRSSGTEYEGKVSLCVGDKTIKVNVITYDDYMLQYAENSRVGGELSKVYGDSNYVLTIVNKDNPLKVGDKVTINDQQLTVGGTLSDGLFADSTTIICSEETFTRLMGERQYAMINIQMKEDATDADMMAISSIAGENNIFSDMREDNRETRATYYAFRICAYSFLAIIALITILNIVNSTSMSVTAKMKQYGIMRAVGMECRQLTKVISAEVLTYTICGCAVGGIIGLISHKFLYQYLITSHFGNAWSVPIKEFVLIVFIVIITSIAAIYGPSKRIKKMAITSTINEL